MPGADIKFSVGGPPLNGLSAAVKSRLASYGWTKDVRMPYNAEATASGMAHADFCLLPLGDDALRINPGRRLIDAVAAGCVPILIGDALKPPFSSLLSYDAFSLRIAESEFLRYPRSAVGDALEKAVLRLGGSDAT